MANEAGDPDTQQRNRNNPPHETKRQHVTKGGRRNDRNRYRHRMTDRERGERFQDHAATAILKPTRNSEEPSHCRIDPMRGAERGQHEPGVHRISHCHSA
jgi:hypothetical protein